MKAPKNARVTDRHFGTQVLRKFEDEHGTLDAFAWGRVKEKGRKVLLLVNLGKPTRGGVNTK